MANVDLRGKRPGAGGVSGYLPTFAFGGQRFPVAPPADPEAQRAGNQMVERIGDRLTQEAIKKLQSVARDKLVEIAIQRGVKGPIGMVVEGIVTGPPLNSGEEEALALRRAQIEAAQRRTRQRQTKPKPPIVSVPSAGPLDRGEASDRGRYGGISLLDYARRDPVEVRRLDGDQEHAE